MERNTVQEINSLRTDLQIECIPNQNSSMFFVETDRLILKFIWKCRGHKIAKITLGEKKMENPYYVTSRVIRHTTPLGSRHTSHHSVIGILWSTLATPLLTLLQPFILGSRCPAPPLRAHLWWLPLLTLPWPLPPPWECWSSSNTGRIMPHHCSAVFTAVHRIKATPSTKTSATQTQVPLCSSLIPHAAGILNALGQGLGSVTSASADPYKHPTLSSSPPQNTFIPQRSIIYLPQDTVTPLVGDPGFPQSWLLHGWWHPFWTADVRVDLPSAHRAHRESLAYILSIYTISKNKQNTVHWRKRLKILM